MSEKAIETEEEVETGFTIEEDETEEVESLEVEAESEEVDEVVEEAASADDDEGEVEIVLEGEDEPTSIPAPRGVRRLVNRLKDAKAETEEEKTKRESLEAENSFLREQLKGKNVDKEPEQDDFDSDEDYQAELKEFYKREAKKAGAAEASRVIAEAQQQTTQAQHSQTRGSELDEHYKRADASGIKGYDELEGMAIDVMGQEFVEEIAANTDKAHIVIAHLGVNRGKAEKYARMAQTQPVKALLEIGALAEALKVKRKHSPAADPETVIDKGLTTSKDGPLKGVRFE